jgi:hypothetical protein
VREDSINYAAQNFSPAVDVASSIYADLWAIKLTSYESLLPWTADPTSYPYPAYLQGIVDHQTGNINHDELERAIAEYRPYANV